MLDVPATANEDQQITLFMLVTERDCVFADASIASYDKIFRAPDRPPGHFRLYVYLNGLSQRSKSAYVARWSARPYVQLFDNASKVADLELYPGQEILSPEGVVRQRDDYAENYDELWTSELPTFSTPLIATVDADFEVLHPDFYFHLLDALEADPRHVGASTSHSETARVYDTYSKRDIVLHERNHTWFCIYRRGAFDQSHISHFYHKKIEFNKDIIVFDSAAHFQYDLRNRCGRTFATLPIQFGRSFIHYGAASKNKSITRRNAWLYRRMFICANVGVLYGSNVGMLGRTLNGIVRRITRLLFQKILERVAAERRTYIYDDPD